MEAKENRGLAGRLSELLRVYGMSVNALAAEVGGTTAKYYKLLNGKSKPDFETIYAILDRFPEISAEWFMRNEGPMKKGDILSKEDAEILIAENRAVKAMYRQELLGKAKGTSSHPQIDREGASEQLSYIIGINKASSNMALLRSTNLFRGLN